jgi:hypothetical protein
LNLGYIIKTCGTIWQMFGKLEWQNLVKKSWSIELSIKSSLVGLELHPSFDVSSPPVCCPQSHEIL